MSQKHGFIHGVVVVIVLLSLSGLGLAQQPPQAQPIAVQQVKGNVYIVKGGSGANTGFFIGDKEVVVIDAKTTAESAQRMIEEIGKLTAKPITGIILTHSDGDHVNGLSGFPKGLKIYGHPQTKKDMEDASKQPNLQYLMDYLPNQACSPCEASRTSAMLVRMGHEDIQLYFFGAAHTSGDLIVYFPVEKVAFVGDLVFVGRDPLIHRQKGGTSLGLARNLDAMLALDADAFIPGHADLLTKQDVRGVAASIKEKQDKIKGMIADGRPLDEIKKAFGVEDRPSQPGRPRFLSLIEVIYLDLTEKK